MTNPVFLQPQQNHNNNNNNNNNQQRQPPSPIPKPILSSSLSSSPTKRRQYNNLSVSTTTTTTASSSSSLSPVRYYHNQNPSLSPAHYYHSQSFSQHQSQQPLHYRTNFGKDYGYRPPSPTTPPATPTLLTQWSSQQGLARKKQLLLQRQQQLLRLPQLQSNYDSNKNDDEIPFDEREQHQQQQQPSSLQRYHEYQQQHLQQQQQQSGRLNLSVTAVNSPSSPRRITMPPVSTTQHPSSSVGAASSSPQRTRVTFQAKAYTNGSNLTPSPRSNMDRNQTPPRSIQNSDNNNNRSNNDILLRNSTRPSNDNLRINTNRNTNNAEEDNGTGNEECSSIDNNTNNNRSPMARMAANNNKSNEEYTRRYIPPQLSVLYSSPVRTSVPKMSLIQPTELKGPNHLSQKNAITTQLSDTSSTGENEMNEESTADYSRSNKEDDEDDFDYVFDDDVYDQIGGRDDNRNSSVEGFRLPQPRISGPRIKPALELSIPVTASTKQQQGSKQQQPNSSISIIGGPDMNTLNVDEASALTGDDQLSLEIIHQAVHHHHHPDNKSNTNHLVKNVIGSKEQPQRYNGLTSKYFNNLQPESPTSNKQPHPYHKRNTNNSTSSTTTTDTSSAEKDIDSLNVAGVSRYMKHLDIGKDKKTNQPNEIVQQNVIVLKTTDDDSLFDFTASSSAITAELNEELESLTAPPGAAAVDVGGMLKRGDNQPSQPVSQNQQQQHQQAKQHPPYDYPNRLISLLQTEDTDDDTCNTSFEQSDGGEKPTPMQQRAQAAWKLGRSRAAAQAAASTLMMKDRYKQDQNHHPMTPQQSNLPTSGSRPSMITSTSTSYDGVSQTAMSAMATSVSEDNGLNTTTTTTTSYNTEEEADSLLASSIRKGMKTRIAIVPREERSDLQFETRTNAIHNTNSAFDRTVKRTEHQASAARSPNSFHTKSSDSEVDDARDIFGIGHPINPERRTMRYCVQLPAHFGNNPQMQHQQEGAAAAMNEETTQESSVNQTDADDTANEEVLISRNPTDEDNCGEESEIHESVTVTTTEEPIVNDNNHALKTGSVQKEQQGRDALTSKGQIVVMEEKKEDDQLFGGVWSYVGDRLANVVTTAFGFDVESVSAAKSPRLANEDSYVSTPTSLQTTTSTRSKFSFPESPSKTDTSSPMQTNLQDQQQHPNQVLSGWNILDFASDVLLGPAPLSPCNNVSKQANALPEPETIFVPTEPSMPVTLLEDDIRLVDLAIQAAVSLHKINGYEFDSSCEIDIVNDIKFSVVDLKLPLGLMFQENESGCWVTNVLPDGNAALTQAVHTGDQLAAVFGISAIDMTVDEVAQLVRQPKSETVELTFLRYIGPFRPHAASVVEEEGYEVMAKKRFPSLDSVEQDHAAIRRSSTTNSCLRIPKLLQHNHQPQKSVSFKLPTASSSLSETWNDASTPSKGPSPRSCMSKNAILPSFRRSSNNNHNKSSDLALKLMVQEAHKNETALPPKKKRGLSSLFGIRKKDSTGP